MSKKLSLIKVNPNVERLDLLIERLPASRLQIHFYLDKRVKVPVSIVASGVEQFGVGYVLDEIRLLNDFLQLHDWRKRIDYYDCFLKV